MNNRGIIELVISRNNNLEFVLDIISPIFLGKKKEIW